MVKFVIDIRQLRVHAAIGAQTEEQILGQSLQLDLRLDVEAPLRADQVNQTLDYARVIEKVRDFAAHAGQIKLIETFAQRLATCLLAEFSELQRVALTVEKSFVPVRDFTGRVSVSMEQTRES
jgi:dihydroneopterin aldolase